MSKNGFSSVSACGGCCGISCYNGTVDTEENLSNDDFENYIICLFEKFVWS